MYPKAHSDPQARPACPISLIRSCWFFIALIVCVCSSILVTFNLLGSKVFTISNWCEYSVVYRTIHNRSAAVIPVAIHDLLWVSWVVCEVPRALPGKPGNIKHVIPKPLRRPCVNPYVNLSKTQPGTYLWVAACYNRRPPSDKIHTLRYLLGHFTISKTQS